MHHHDWRVTNHLMELLPWPSYRLPRISFVLSYILHYPSKVGVLPLITQYYSSFTQPTRICAVVYTCTFQDVVFIMRKLSFSSDKKSNELQYKYFKRVRKTKETTQGSSRDWLPFVSLCHFLTFLSYFYSSYNCLGFFQVFLYILELVN